MTDRRFVQIAIALACCVLGGALIVCADNQITYDGKWWLSVDKREREGFADGYIACYSSDVKGKVKFEYTGQMYEPRLTEYLHRNAMDAEMPLEKLLWKMTTVPYAPKARTNQRKGQFAQGKYGIFDGEFWRGAGASGRVGFVEGFLYCYSKYGRAAKGAFSKPASWYAGEISRWYELDEEGGINMSKINTKIPELLFQLPDKDGH